MTPTKWRIGDAGHTIFGPKKPDGSLPAVIATVRSSYNAPLLAAAPEMFDALISAFHYINDGEEFSKDQAWNKEATLKLIKETISKAAVGQKS